MGEDGRGVSDNYDPHGDPKTDPRKRRRIRYEYRELISDTQKNRHEFIRPQSKGLHKALDKAENLFNQVTLTREAVLDSHLLVVVANLGSQQAQQLQTHLITFDCDVFVEKLITFMGGRNIADTSREEDDDDEEISSRRHHSVPKLNWKKLGQKACVLFRRTPSIDFMLGPLSMDTPANRKPRRDVQSRRPEKPDSSQKVTPNELEKVEAQEESTTKEVNRIYQVLFDNTVSEDEDIPICLFKFIINPHSFSETIENLFHLSFLVKDGRAKINFDNSGLPLVATEDMPGEEDQLEKHQIVVHLTLQEYQEIIKTFNITESIIPPRQHFH